MFRGKPVEAVVWLVIYNICSLIITVKAISQPDSNSYTIAEHTVAVIHNEHPVRQNWHPAFIYLIVKRQLPT